MHQATGRLGLALGLALLITATAASRPAGAAPMKKLLGKLDLRVWDVRKEVFFKVVQVWRRGCELHYRFTFKRQRSYPLQLRLQLSLDAGPATVATTWHSSSKSGPGSAAGHVDTFNCWVRKARRLRRANFETLGDPPRRTAAGGKEFLGRVTFNRWGSSGDVYYRHIKAWRLGCRVHYQFLYKRRTGIRRRLRMKLTFDNGELKTPWYRSKARGWREIVGSVETPDCFADKTQTLRTAGFESERY